MAPRPRPTQQPHPLLMNHVIERICETRLLKSKDLRELRKVCRSWNHEATKVISSQTVLNLNLGPQHGLSKLHEVMDMVENPYGNFPVPTTVQLSTTDISNDRRFFVFLLTIGKRVQELEDKACRYNIQDNIKMFQFPKLKKFEFTVPPQLLPITEIPSNLLQHRILRDSRLLEEVSITWKVVIDEGNKRTVNVEHDLLRSIPRTLKKLSLFKALTPVTAGLLGSINWTRLSSLKLDFCNSRVPLTTGQFCGLFQHCNNTLTDLSVVNYKHSVKFPVFPRVTNLTLGIHDRAQNAHNEHDLKSFSVHFPSVTTLDITLLRSLSVVEALFPENTIVPQVVTCKLPFFLTPSNVYTRLCQALVGVKTLHVIPIIYRERVVLSTVFSQMPDLENLLINFLDMPEGYKEHPTCMDSIFMGTEISNLSVRIPANRKPGMGWKAFNLSNTRRGPGIVDLKKLKTLHMRSLAPADMRITDVTAFLALLNMKSLQELKMDNFKLSGLSLDVLKRRFGDLDHIQSRSEFEAEFESIPKITLVPLPLPEPEDI